MKLLSFFTLLLIKGAQAFVLRTSPGSLTAERVLTQTRSKSQLSTRTSTRLSLSDNPVPFTSDDKSRREAIFSILRKSVGTTSASLLTSLSSPVSAREFYLSEPTEEFKESERQRMEFRQAQALVKKDFLVVLERLTSKSKTEDEIVKDLEDLKDLVKKTGGMPLGIKKEDMYKIVRRKKSMGFWPTKCEYSYQELVREVAYQQSPNKDKDETNPL